MKYRKSDAMDYARENLRGLWAANLTPFSADLSLDEPGFRRNLRHWADDLEIDGLFIAGKQAEFFSMSLEERKRTFDIAIDEIGDRCGTIMSCSDENLDVVMELAGHAQDIGADYAIVHSPPLYFHQDVNEVLEEYYSYIADRVDIGIAMWHQPDYGYTMSPELCARIAKIPNIVAIKYSVQPKLYAELTRISCDDLIVSTSAEDRWLDNIIELGWQVYLCSTPPYLMQTKADKRMREYTDLAMKGEFDQARAVRDSLEPVREALKLNRPKGKPQAYQKYWQELLGQTGGRVRRPLLELTETEQAATRDAFEACGLDLDIPALAGS